MSTTGSEAQSSATTAASRGTAYRILRTLGVSPSLRGSGAPISARSRRLKASLTACSAVAVLALVPAGASAQDTCPNAQFRTGASANLPDCRAYELVSLPDSAGLPAVATNINNIEDAWDMDLVREDGNSIMYQSTGGALPGYEGTGLVDRYLATRSPAGWETSAAGPTAAQSELPWPGGITDNHAYSFFQTPGPPSSPFRPQQDNGSLVTPYWSLADLVFYVDYIRSPNGDYELVGQGSIGEMPRVDGQLITPDAEHIIFQTTSIDGGTQSQDSVQLEPNAPPSGTQAIYDRSLDGPTHVVSLLPGDVTPAAGQHAVYRGASADGELVAFKTAPAASGVPHPPLYLRVDRQETQEVVSTANTFAGIRGGHVFYADASEGDAVFGVQAPGDLFSYDPVTESTTQITNTGDARFVNVSDDGSRVYFVSSSQIGGEGTVGQPNLYLWERDGESTTYIATVSPSDITDDHSNLPNPAAVGSATANMATWAYAVAAGGSRQIGGRAGALNRSTPDGSVLVFESVAQLTSFDNGGHGQVYRYDVAEDEVTCLSCVGPEPATGAARFQSYQSGFARVEPLRKVHPVENLMQGGDVVAFEAEGDLLPADSNGTVDVYRWSADGGLALVSTGEASAPSFLYDTTRDGRDIAFVTPQDLVPIARNGATRALYTARVGGGLAGQHVTERGRECVGDACQSDPVDAPAAQRPGSDASFPVGGSGDGRKRNCATLSKRASRVAKQAKRLGKRARKANRAGNDRRAKKLRVQARKKTRQVRKLRKRAKACRGGSQ